MEGIRPSREGTNLAANVLYDLIFQQGSAGITLEFTKRRLNICDQLLEIWSKTNLSNRILLLHI
jgi:hypothetical protein